MKSLSREGVQPSAEPTGTEATGNAAIFWAAAVLITLSLYWVCLRWLYPGFFLPLSPSHRDFYDYASYHSIPIRNFLVGYPRPLAFITIGILGWGGLSGTMASGVALALVNVLLVVAIVRQAFRLFSFWMLAPLTLYELLLFAHPDFYMEHRHDMPMEVSFLYLAIGLMAWMAWVKRSGRNWVVQAGLLVVCLCSMTAFAFAKETFFVSALLAIAALGWSDAQNRRRHTLLFLFVMILEVTSILWSRHVNSPFINAGGPDNPYLISLSPLSFVREFFFYASHLLNPALALIVALVLMAAWPSRVQFIRSAILLAAGLAAFLPHSLLPNHEYEEYAWAAAPLALAPLLLMRRPGANPVMRRWVAPAIGLLTVLAFVGPFGFRRSYQRPLQRYLAHEDLVASRLASSLAVFDTTPPTARILVVGLTTSFTPWQCPAFTRMRFGTGRLWEVVAPRSVTFRFSSRLVQFADPPAVGLRDFDYVASYDGSGGFHGLRPVKAIPASEPIQNIVVPVMPALERVVSENPHNAGVLLGAAEQALDWSQWQEAGQFLGEAAREGTAGARYDALKRDLREGPGQVVQAKPAGELTAKPARIVATGGTGFGTTELFWRAPSQLAIQVRVNAPDGSLFADGEGSGHGLTGNWVKNGMQFYLQNVTGGKPLTAENTLAQVTVEVTK